MIHQTAIVHSEAELADDVQVGPYSVIGPGVRIDSGTVIGPHVVIARDTSIGKNNRFFQFASIGEDCQDLKYKGETTRLEIGDNNMFRECTTVHRGTVQDDGVTRIGSDNLVMTYAHVAHDCQIGNHCVIANAVALAGHVHVGDWAIIGGMAGVHQFCHVGEHSFTAAGTVLLRDLPPYVMVGGKEVKPHGINSEGLRRRGFSKEAITQIRRAYKVLYRSGNRAEEAVNALLEMAKDTPEVRTMAEFVANSQRGIVR